MDTFMGIFVLALVAVSGIIVTGGAGWFVWRCAVDALRSDSDLDLHMRVVLGIMGLLTILALAFSYLAILI